MLGDANLDAAGCVATSAGEIDLNRSLSEQQPRLAGSPCIVSPWKRKSRMQIGPCSGPDPTTANGREPAASGRFI